MKRLLTERDGEIQQLKINELNFKSENDDMDCQIRELEASLHHAERAIKMLNEELDRRQEIIQRLRQDRETLLVFADKNMSAQMEIPEINRYRFTTGLLPL